MKILKFLVIALCMTSCGTMVNYDYETTTDFKQYKTFNYFDDLKTGLSELDNNRLFRAIDNELENMGMEKAENPDFFIDIHSVDVQNRNSPNVGVGVGGTGRSVGGGISVGLPLGTNKNTRELIIEFVDDSKGGTFWQAISESSYSQKSSPEKREAYFEELVSKIFAKYPPKK